MMTTFKRILRAGFVSMWRNSFVSIAAVFVMTMTIMIIGSLMFLSALIDQFVDYVQDKVDVNVYFVTTADEQEIMNLKEALEGLPEVAYVEYTSRQDAYEKFRANHQDDPDIVGALDELGDNPFGASLAVKAVDSTQFENIFRYVKDRQEADVAPFIDSVNYERNKTVIDQLNVVTDYVERLGLIISLVFAAASMAITFNTIRLAIYTAREEIGVMRLVGATNMYIRGPFMVEGTLYGIIAGVVSLILFFPLSYVLRGASEAMFNADIFAYYVSNLWYFILVLVLTGAALGMVSSFLAVRKYLSV
jgi:cell division transport system permease protein